MSINRMLADRAGNNSLVSKALRLSMLETTGDLMGYLGLEGDGHRDIGGLNDGVFPHERGSIDSYDDMRASLRLTSGLLDMALDEDGTEEGQRSRMQKLVRDESCLMALTEDLSKLIFPGWDEDRIGDFILGPIDEGGPQHE